MKLQKAFFLVLGFAFLVSLGSLISGGYNQKAQTIDIGDTATSNTVMVRQPAAGSQVSVGQTLSMRCDLNLASGVGVNRIEFSWYQYIPGYPTIAGVFTSMNSSGELYSSGAYTQNVTIPNNPSIQNGDFTFHCVGYSPSLSNTIQGTVVTSISTEEVPPPPPPPPPTPDTTVPTTPTNMSVTDRTSYTLKLNWTTSTDNVGVAGYKIYRNNGGSTAINTTTPIAEVNGSATSYTNVGLLSNRSYKYRVRAFDAAGNLSGWATLPGSTTTTVTAATLAVQIPTNVTIAEPTTSSLRINWTAPASGEIFNYAIYANAGGTTAINTTTPIATIPFGTNTYVHQNLSASTTYKYRVAAFDPANNRSALTTAKSGVTSVASIAAPSVPSGINFSGATQSSLNISWGASTGASGQSIGYKIFRSTSSGGTYSQLTSGLTPAPVSGLISGLSVTNTGLSASTQYYYKVQACYTAIPTNCSAQSSVANSSTTAAPDTVAPTPVPTLTVGTVTQNSVALSWTTSTDVSAPVTYKVFRNGTQVGSATSGTSITDSGLTSGTTYSYTVSACDSVGNCSAQSIARTATTLSAPAVPTGVSVGSPTTSSLTVSWSAVTGATSYRVYRMTSSGALDGAIPPFTVSAPALSTTFSGLTAGTSYYYSVSALNAVGESARSSVATGTTSAPQITISSLELVRTNGTVVEPLTGGEVINIGTQNGGLGTNISIKANTNPATAGSVLFSLQKPNSTTYTLTENTSPYTLFGDTGASTLNPWSDLQLGGYTLTVTPYAGANGTGQVGVPQTIQFLVQNNDDVTAPVNPTNVTVTYRSANQIKVAWTNSTSSDVSSYKVYRDGASVGFTDHPTNIFTDASVNASTLYGYKVTASDASGNEAALPGTSAPSPALSTLFPINAQVTTNVGVDVKVSPESVATAQDQLTGAIGTITNGPVWVLGGVQYWYVDFQTGTDGWVNQSSLNNYVAPSTNGVSLTAPVENSNVVAGQTVPMTCTVTTAPGAVVYQLVYTSWSSATGSVGLLTENGVSFTTSNQTRNVTIPANALGQYQMQCVAYFSTSGVYTQSSSSYYVNVTGGVVPPPTGDTTAPTVNITAPTSAQVLPVGTTSTTLTVVTNENATCKWSASNVAYGSMTETFTGAGSTSHNYPLLGLTNGTNYTRHISCADTAGNASTAQARSFSVASGTVPPPPPTSSACSPSTLPSNASTQKAVALCTSVSSSPASITLSWSPVTGRTVSNITISRKVGTATTWTQVATPVGSATSWTDTAVSVGQYYEYKVSMNSGAAVGYTASGIDVPTDSYKGKLVLVIDNTFQTSLATQIQSLIDDLNADKWVVAPIYVSRTATPASVRASIKAVYDADPTNTKAVYLLGHVPVASLGNQNPDGHANRGMSSDGFYGDMNSTWTTSADGCSGYTWGPQQVSANMDVPATSSRFCISSGNLPSALELQVGRVDMYKLPAFGGTEQSLLSSYLTKVSNYKKKAFTPVERALIKDTWATQDFGYSHGKSFVSSFPAIVGAEDVTINTDYNSLANLINNQSYLWMSASYNGSNTAGSVGSTAGSTAVAASSVWGSVFNIVMGSYFGEWNDENSYLRAILASGNGMVSMYGGPRYVYVHQMAMGQDVGSAFMKSVNNTTSLYSPTGGIWDSNAGGNAYMSLMGDPTLRAAYVARPSNLIATNVSGQASFDWTASTDTVLGYNIYEIESNQVRKVNSSIITGTSFFSNDTYTAGKKYMVTAVARKTSAGGTYLNESLGVITITVASTPVTPPAQGSSVMGINGPVGPNNLENVTVSANPYGGTDYFVACSTGNDSNNGTSVSAPWKTLSKLNSSTGSMPVGSRILFKRGETCYGTINAYKSGTQSAPMEYNAYGSGSAPIISGTDKITGTWTAHSGNIWKTTIAANLNPKYLFVNSDIQTVAKHPNTGWLTTASTTGSAITNSWIGTQTAGALTGANVVFRSSPWSWEKEVVSSHSGSSVSFPASNYAGNLSNGSWKDVGWGFLLENKLSLLDTAGEWFYNKTSGELYFWAPASANPNSLNVSISTKDTGFSIGWQRTDVKVKNLIFEGFNLTGLFHPSGEGDMKRVVVENNEIRNTPSGVRMYTTNGNATALANTIRNNYIHDIHSEGIYMQGGNGHLVEGNVLRDIGNNAQLGAKAEDWNFFGIRVVDANSNYTLRRNTVENIGYIGIVAGGSGLITENIVSNTGDILNDGGGIAIDFTNGLSITKNIIKDISYDMSTMPPLYAGYTFIVKGIYFGDKNIQNTTVAENIITNVPGSGIWMDHSKPFTGNIVRDNIVHDFGQSGIGFSDYSNYTTGPCTSPSSNSTCFVPQFNDMVTGNKIYATRASATPLTKLYVYSNGTGAVVDFGTVDNNYYYNPFTTTKVKTTRNFGGGTNTYTFPQWLAASNEDDNSTYSNYTTTSANAAQIFYNETASPITRSVNGCNANGTPLTGNQTIQPFRALVVEYGNC